MRSVITESVAQSISESETIGKVEKKSGKRIGYNYIIIKSYKESQKNDVVKCLYIKSLTDFGFCVIKEGSKGDTKDKNGRDIIDRLKWQQQLHQELQDKIPIPRLLGHFEERGNFYLVIEHIKGKALRKLVAEKRKELRQSIITGGKLGRKFLDYLIQIAGILETLHSQEVVHRDATPNNYMITPGGKVALIDMEMCYSMQTKFPTPAFALGTRGYMSKQQQAISTPTAAEDIFAFGAIILEIWSGISPGKLTDEPIAALIQKTSFFIPDQQVTNIVTQCLLPEDDRRPNAMQIRQVLELYKTDLLNKVQRPVNDPFQFSNEHILATAQEGIRTLASPLLADEEKGWFSDDITPSKDHDKHKLRKMWYASYSHGVSGIIYMLTQAKRIGLDIEITHSFVQKGLNLIKQKYIDRIEIAKAGLHFGSDGIAGVLSFAIRNRLIEASDDHLKWINLLLQESNQSDNLATGLAGQGLVNLCCKPFVNSESLSKRLQSFADTLMGKQNSDGFWTSGNYKQKFTRKKINKTNKGFVEGMAGIICFMLEFGYRYKHEDSIHSAQQGLKWLIKKARHKNGTVHWLTSKNKELGYDLYNGNSGIALSFIKAYQYTGQPIYRQYAVNALNGISKNIIDNNIGQRNGLAGLGEVYLEAYRVFKDETWLHRARWIAQVVMHLKKQHPKYGVYWLVEHEHQPVANFMIGNSGILHFLLRCCYADQIGFPLMPE